MTLGVMGRTIASALPITNTTLVCAGDPNIAGRLTKIIKKIPKTHADVIAMDLIGGAALCACGGLPNIVVAYPLTRTNYVSSPPIAAALA